MALAGSSAASLTDLENLHVHSAMPGSLFTAAVPMNLTVAISVRPAVPVCAAGWGVVSCGRGDIQASSGAGLFVASGREYLVGCGGRKPVYVAA